MYPDFSYLFHDLFGTRPDNALSLIKTFGFFLAAGVGVLAYFFKLELKRKAKEGIFKPVTVIQVEGLPASLGDIIGNAFLGLVLGMKLPYAYQHFKEFQLDPAAGIFSMKGNIVLGLILAAVFGYWRYWDGERKKIVPPKKTRVEIYPHDKITEIAMVAAFSGILGAKVFDILEHLDSFFKDPIGVFLSGSGLAIYGGLIFGYIAVVWYLRKNFKGISILHAMDAIAPALILGYGTGRIGCQLSGDGDWGIPVKGVTDAGVEYAYNQPSWVPDILWSQTYPHNVAGEGVLIPDCTWNFCHVLPTGVFPTPVYETGLSILIFVILWTLRKRIKTAGVLFFVFMILDGLERFFIEKIRVNIKYDIFGFHFTQAQLIAIGMIIIGIIGIIWRKRASKQLE
ncbi:MAG TPA: hypothetical protein ENK85_06615 [Saprospiraceae bacterium]|nr:hypothetical protein [Saprospiraceae bacterium]